MYSTSSPKKRKKKRKKNLLAKRLEGSFSFHLQGAQGRYARENLFFWKIRTHFLE